MFLFRKRVPGISIRHSYERLSEPVDEARVIELANELKVGHENVIEEVVRRHIRLALMIASQYAASSPNKVLDIVSEATVAIVFACHKVIKGKLKDDNLTGYIISQIHSKVFTFLRNDHLVKVPASTYILKKKQGLEVKVKVRSLIDPPTKVKRGPSVFELWEMIEKSITNEQEREVISLRSKSYSDKEIAGMMGLSIARIAQIRSAVETRFEELERHG